MWLIIKYKVKSFHILMYVGCRGGGGGGTSQAQTGKNLSVMWQPKAKSFHILMHQALNHHILGWNIVFSTESKSSVYPSLTRSAVSTSLQSGHAWRAARMISRALISTGHLGRRGMINGPCQAEPTAQGLMTSSDHVQKRDVNAIILQ